MGELPTTAPHAHGMLRLKSTLSWRRCCAMIALAALIVPLGSGMTGPGAVLNAPAVLAADAPDAPDAAESDAPADEAPAALGADRKLIKVIPDQKAFIGSKKTVIDLQEAFAGTEVADGGPLTFEMILGKDKAAVASIDGSRLSLEWKQKAAKDEVTIRATNAAGEFIDTKFEVKVWKADWLQMAMAVLCGLGIFLLGMKSLSDGLQSIAGNRLRRMISLVTDNRLLAAGIGTLVTATIQSSSITTVMVVGFVNSGFMTLAQAVGVIMGANIGTTVTAWILVMKIGKLGQLLIGVGVFGYLFSKNERWRYTFMAAMGLGMVFFGLELMKDGFSFIKALPEFELWFQRFQANDYPGILMCAGIGCLLTCIVQSSSATVGITISLAAIGVIDLRTSAALVLGENIGTTITALLASIGATTAARRAAYFHTVFNVLGVLWVTALFKWPFFPFVEWVVNGFFGGNVAAGIAVAHTTFNLTNTAIFLPLCRRIATLLERFVPDRQARQEPKLTNLDVRLLESPAIAVEQSRVEVLRMGQECVDMMESLRQVLHSAEPDDRQVQELFYREEALDSVQDEVTQFMTHLLSSNASHEVVDEGRRQIRMADEYESVSDYLTTILKSHLKLQHAGLAFAPSRQTELAKLHDMAAEYLALVAKGYERRQGEVYTAAKSQGEAITKRVKELRDNFLTQMSEERPDPQLSVAYNAQLNAYRRVRDHVFNIAEAMAGLK